MQSNKFLCAIERNMKMVDAIESAIVAMRLTDGCAITMEGVNGRLNFQREIGKMMLALRLLGVDDTEVFPVKHLRSRRH